MQIYINTRTGSRHRLTWHIQHELPFNIMTNGDPAVPGPACLLEVDNVVASRTITLAVELKVVFAKSCGGGRVRSCEVWVMCWGQMEDERGGHMRSRVWSLQRKGRVLLEGIMAKGRRLEWFSGCKGCPGKGWEVTWGQSDILVAMRSRGIQIHKLYGRRRRMDE